MAKKKPGFNQSEYPNETRVIKQTIVELLSKGKKATLSELCKLHPELIDFFDKDLLSSAIYRLKKKITAQLNKQGIHPEENPESRSPLVESENEDEEEEEEEDSDNEVEEEESDNEVEEDNNKEDQLPNKAKPAKPSTKVDLEEDELSEHLEAMTFPNNRTPADVTAEYAGDLGRRNHFGEISMWISERDGSTGLIRLLNVEVHLTSGNYVGIDLQKFQWNFADQAAKNGIIVKVPIPSLNHTRRLQSGQDSANYESAFRARYHNEQELMDEHKMYGIDFGKIVIDRFHNEDVHFSQDVTEPSFYLIQFTILEEQKNVTMTSKKKKEMAGYSFTSPPRSTPQGSNGNYGLGGGTYPHHQQQYYGHQHQNQSHFAHQQNQNFASGNGYNNSQAGGSGFTNSSNFNFWNSNQAGARTPQTGNYAYAPAASVPAPAASVPAPAASVPAPAAPAPAPASFFSTPHRTNHNQVPQSSNNQGSTQNFDPGFAYGMDSSNPPAPDYSSSSSNLMSGMRSGRRNDSSGIRKKESKPSTKFRRSPGDNDVKDARQPPAADPFGSVNNNEVGGATSFDDSINPYPYSSYFGNL